MSDDISPDSDMANELGQTSELSDSPLRISDLAADPLTLEEGLEFSSKVSSDLVSITPVVVNQVEFELAELRDALGDVPLLEDIEALIGELVDAGVLDINPGQELTLAREIDTLNMLKEELQPAYGEKWGEELSITDLMIAEQLGLDLIEIGPDGLSSCLAAREEWLNDVSPIVGESLGLDPPDAQLIIQHGAELVEAAQTLVSHPDGVIKLNDPGERQAFIQTYADASGISLQVASHIISRAEEVRDMGANLDFKPLFGNEPLHPDVLEHAEALKTTAINTALMLNMDVKSAAARMSMGIQADDLGEEVLTPTQQGYVREELDVLDSLGLPGVSENMRVQLALELNAEKEALIHADKRHTEHDDHILHAAMQHAATKGLSLPKTQPQLTESIKASVQRPERESLAQIVSRALNKTASDTLDKVRDVVGPDRNIFQRIGSVVQLATESTIGLVANAVKNFGDRLALSKAA